MGAGLVSVLVIGALSIWTIDQAGDTAHSAGSETLEAQTRDYMVGLASANAAQLDLQLERAQKDVELASRPTSYKDRPASHTAMTTGTGKLRV